ncbi:uncharacterized protein LOC133314715 [Gastrolobium bilobum]|uniref:uncharacterized protein LOC133314715 n=1 Tax=Gastrolobium bilobum TaxID=150636 RepID=UPI002AB0341E|nr:uncharacterized protein LOC133314715 [Gastrolobium bilobum]
MAFTEPRLASFQVSTSEQQHQALPNVKPTATITDVFRFEVTVTLRHISSTRVINISTLVLQTTVHMRCKRFFLSNDQDLQRTALDFLRALLLPYPMSLQYFTRDCLDEISGRIIHQVQQLFDFIKPHAAGSQDQGQVFPLSLEIVLDVPSVEENQEMELTDEEIQELESAIMEEESMQSVRMVSASNEAIQSLKTYVLPENCSVCMETFGAEGEDVKISPMPCGHVFHHHCIVQWLQTSYMCPLCRYPMPTSNN